MRPKRKREAERRKVGLLGGGEESNFVIRRMEFDCIRSDDRVFEDYLWRWREER